MIGCFNMNGHDCNQSDLDTVFFVPRDVLEDAEVGRRIGHEALIYDPFNVMSDEDNPEDDEMSFEEAVNDNELGDFEEIDLEFQETIWSSLLLGSDYDWDDGLGEDPLEWIQRRYADVIQLNDKIGYQSRATEILPFTATFIGRSRTNVRNRHWSESKSLRRENVNRDHLRGKAHRK